MRFIALALAAFLAPSLSAFAAPVSYETAGQNLKTMLVQQFRIDASELRDTDSLLRDWLMDLSVRELVEQYQHRFNGPDAKRVLRIMRVSCNNDSVRCIAQSISAASK